MKKSILNHSKQGSFKNRRFKKNNKIEKYNE
jgi:hypothetical protein